MRHFLSEVERLSAWLLGAVVAWAGAWGVGPALAADPVPHQVIAQASLQTSSGVREVQLPHVLDPSDFAPAGSTVRYRLTWQMPASPEQPQVVYVSKMSLSGRLYLNGTLMGACGEAPLETLRCLHQPQYFKISSVLLKPGTNLLEFEIYATARQMNGLSAVRVGDAQVLHSRFEGWRDFVRTDLQVGLIWLSALLGLLSLTVSAILREESVFFWFGLTSVLNVVASLNGVVTHPLVNIDFYNWVVFSSRLVNVPLSFLTLLAIFGKDGRRVTAWLAGYALVVPLIIALSGNNRTIVFALYAPLVFSCPVLLYLSLRWSLKSRQPLQMAGMWMMALLFACGVVDWLRLGGQTAFEGVYLTVYAYSGMLLTIGLMLVGRLAAALLRSRKMERLLEQKVAERMAYEVTENIPVGTFSLSTRPGFSRPRLSFLSRRFLQITGLPPDLVRSSALQAFAIVHEDDRLSMRRQFAQALHHKQPLSGRMRITVQGRLRWVNLEAGPREQAEGATVWEGVLIDETDQVLAREAAERNRAALQAHLVAQSRMQEREELLRDMHDGFGSQLAGVRLMVERRRIAPEDLPSYLDEVSADLHLVVDTLSQGYITFEEAIYDLRYRIERRFADSGIRFRWDLALDGMPPVSPRTILQILRTVQEAMHNAIRHAQARTIRLSASVDLEQGILGLEVCDDGVGMPVQVRHGRGLGNMHTRMREIGAQLHIRAAQPGTCVQMRLDLKTVVASAQRPATA